MKRVLIASTAGAPTDLLAESLEREGYEVEVSREPEEAQALVIHKEYDVVISLLGSGEESLSVIAALRDITSEASTLLLVAEEGSAQEMEARRLGVSSVVTRLEDLDETTNRIVESIGGRK